MSRIRTLPVALAALVALPTLAQEQQAGSEASRNTEEMFQELIAQCDDTDALMLRARIRLQIPRATDAAAAEAQSMMDEAFATCGGGDVEAAKAQLADALAVAEAGVAENFEPETAEEAAEAEPEAGEETEEEGSSWWPF